MVICVVCGINSVCTECIDFDLDNSNSDVSQLCCPSCFIKKDKLGAYVC
jgi:hypothetical protein